MCMFDYCISWDDLWMMLMKVDGLMETYDTLAPAITATLGGALLWFGKVHDKNTIDNHLPLFWRNTSEVLMITAGFLSAIYGAYPTIDAAVRSETDNTSSNYVGALFVNYGGETWIGDLLGFSEWIWVALYLALATFIAGVPLYASMKFNKMYDASADNL